ncbi:hypothetical protein AYJ54_35310 [Bradyrhizobium centrolobii]|uniref:Uncharacterized protein n=1 Tax=Bradyrhizobium centrolobii TaxID=1505087 RepID=A0A176Y8C5_9BRAD|nr:hypothetical protein [Bradyrhizobium centrolobii]OAE97370.1 hypothetical protein AYJ54_35310 [Bradyrhizobium centrolobii]
MVLSERITTATNLLDTLRGRLSDYLDQYRLALYPTLGAVVAFSIAFNWHWLTTAELVRILTALPCMLMMYKCLRCGIGQPDRKIPTSQNGLPSRSTATADQ